MGSQRPLVQADFRADGAGRVFHHGQMMFFSQGQNPPQIAGHPQLVHRQDGPGAMGDGGLEQVRIEVARFQLHVHEDRGGAHVAHGVGRGDEGGADGDDFVAGLQVQGQQGQVQGGGAAGAGHRQRRPHQGGKFLFKGLHLRPLDHPAGEDGPPGRGGLLLAQGRPGYGDWLHV